MSLRTLLVGVLRVGGRATEQAVEVSADGRLLVADAGRLDTDGNPLPLDFDSLPFVFGRNGDGTIQYEERTQGTTTWRQTYSYTDGKLTGGTGWEVQ